MKINIDVNIAVNGKYCDSFLCRFCNYNEEFLPEHCYYTCNLFFNPVFNQKLSIEKGIEEGTDKVLRCNQCLKYKEGKL
jgi:hypothetical protein